MQATQKVDSARGAWNGMGSNIQKDETGIQPSRNEKEHQFLTNLFREFFQTEQSARKHSRVEAQRLGDVPPARAMLAIAAHADSVLPQLRALTKERCMVAVEGAKKVGSMFSVLRNRFADLVLSHEKSYRGTILGLRHGLDLVTLIQYTATVQGDTPLAGFCARWLEVRRPLVEAARDELAWFAAHTDIATEPVKHSSLGRAVQLMVHNVEKIATKLSPEAQAAAAGHATPSA